MSIFDKDWVPNDKQKAWAEKFIWPLVVGMRILTSWYVSILWAFLVPYLFGQSLIFCVLFALFAGGLSWYVWREGREE